MNHGSLFSGIGGFDLASEWMGWENIFHCEWNEFGNRVLKYYWPKSIAYDDITKTDFTIHRGTIDVLSGGFPCQPYSTAGKRLGKEDERHLWPEMLRAIREIQPTWVVGENVSGIISWNGGMVFDEVQADLEAAGYEVIPFVLPACGVNAPHRRDRVWFVAHAVNGGHNARRGKGTKTDGIQGISREEMESREFDGAITHDATNTSNTGLQRGENVRNVGEVGEDGNKFVTGCIPSTWDKFPTQPPVCGRNDVFSGGLVGTTFFESIGINHPSKLAISAAKHRQESIKGYGNAVVPKVVLQIFKAIEQYERLTTKTNS